jgi:hypothetical protein
VEGARAIRVDAASQRYPEREKLPEDRESQGRQVFRKPGVNTDGGRGVEVLRGEVPP